jgi:hypothetical protein
MNSWWLRYIGLIPENTDDFYVQFGIGVCIKTFGKFCYVHIKNVTPNLNEF